ncbi:prolyl oligopeptidase family serine peptidase [Sphingomonas sp.]|uniref:prolyl oligopeptidase family serine peptidase n=1 Tax=Sphingomonas sp. TaxID=28214 RepID=UPI0025D478E7|nr:prolyl oligopeptidase family serine peptidase [Sphingomonas sp.]
MWASLEISVVQAAEKPAAITAENSIETARFMPATGQGDEISISPDGQHYVVRTVRGDLARNGAWIEIRVGRMDSLDGMSDLRRVARLFTTGLGGLSVSSASNDTDATFSPLSWNDNQHVVMGVSDASGIRQVMMIDTVSGKSEFLTHHPTQVHSFGITSTGAILYLAAAPPPVDRTQDLVRTGFSLPDVQDALTILNGRLDGVSFLDLDWNSYWYLQRPGQPPQRLRIGSLGVDPATPLARLIEISPDGRFAVVRGTAVAVPEAWNVYGAADDYLRVALEAGRIDRFRESARDLQQFFLVDLSSGDARPFIDAPAPIARARAAWSPDSRRLVVAPTTLPEGVGGNDGLRGRAAAVYDIATGMLTPVSGDFSHTRSLKWTSPDAFAVVFDEQTASFIHADGRWERTSDILGPSPRPAIAIEIRQDLNVPPKLWAHDARTGQSRMLLDPNDDLGGRLQLGRAERIEGKLQEDQRWDGVLYYPTGYVAGRRYPLILQSVYYRSLGNTFSLYGPEGDGGLGPPQIAPYAARALAARGMFVLHLNVRAPVGTSREGEIAQRTFESAISDLVMRGLVDSKRVGISGFSRNGFYVEYTLTHTEFPFAAAVAADNYDPSYFQTALVGWRPESGLLMGGPPFGRNLRNWIDNAPGFNAECIEAPLLLVNQSMTPQVGTLGHWEIFSRLRYLHRPVELFHMADVSQHPDHTTQNPAQILSVQRRVVDWFDFWLNDHEDPSPARAAQYEHWRALRASRQDRAPRSELDCRR